MTNWSQENIHKHMTVYSSDKQKLGHVTHVYQDSFEVKKGIFSHDSYIPYEAITQVENDDITLSMDADEARQKEWWKRPDYENHLGDPVNLMYDRDHGVHDPFDTADQDIAIEERGSEL
jgi:hypothetical protein